MSPADELALREALYIESQLLPHTWTADVDDPGTDREEFTGKFVNEEGRSTCLYDNAEEARLVARMRNVLPKLIAALDWSKQRVADLEQAHICSEAHIAELELELAHAKEDAARYRALWEKTA